MLLTCLTPVCHAPLADDGQGMTESSLLWTIMPVRFAPKLASLPCLIIIASMFVLKYLLLGQLAWADKTMNAHLHWHQ